MCQACRNQGERGGTGGPLQIFGRADLLPADNDSEKKKIAKKIQASSNSSKTTGSISLVHFIECIKLIFLQIASFILYSSLIFYHDHDHFEKDLS